MTSKKTKAEKKSTKKNEEETVATVEQTEEDVGMQAASVEDLEDPNFDDVDDDDDDDDDMEAAPESASAPKKGPGRGKGPRKPRQIYYECGAIVKGDDGELSIAMAPITVVSPARGEEFHRDAAKLEAIDNFKNKFGVEPMKIDGPFYYVKGQLAHVRKRETLRTNTEEIRFTGQRSVGIYKEWEVLANHLEDGKTAMVWFKSRITPWVPEKPDQKQPPKPNAKRLPLELIQNLKPAD